GPHLARFGRAPALDADGLHEQLRWPAAEQLVRRPPRARREDPGTDARAGYARGAARVRWPRTRWPRRPGHQPHYLARVLHGFAGSAGAPFRAALRVCGTYPG